VNILFHIYLSGSDPELLVGNFMGDFVKGPLDDTYSPRIREGLMLHRKIDSFAQRHPAFQTSRLRLPAYYRLYRGILVDLYYDHFLAKEWDSWSEMLFADFLANARGIIENYLTVMPKQLQLFVPIIFNELLPSYESVSGIQSALERMARRVRRPNPLAEGGAELTRHYEGLKADFERFIVAAQHFTLARGDDQQDQVLL